MNIQVVLKIRKHQKAEVTMPAERTMCNCTCFPHLNKNDKKTFFCFAYHEAVNSLHKRGHFFIPCGQPEISVLVSF